jgi:glycosyltransferase involved in cell wall biosynthesis
MQTVSDFLRRRTLNRIVLQRFDLLIAGANDIRDYLVGEKQSFERIQVVHNWVDFSRKAPIVTRSETLSRLGIAAEALVVGCVGRLHPQKGQLYLLRAFSAILQNVPDAILLLVGDGDEMGMLKKEATLLGVNGRVVFPGALAGQDYVDAMNSIDIYVQPSVFEGLPRTLLDAMYLEKPIVATAVNGNKEAIVDGVNGLLVRERDVDSLARALCRLIHDRDLQSRLARCAHESVVDSFAMDKQLARIELLAVA